jgi:hypothetical protein
VDQQRHNGGSSIPPGIITVKLHSTDLNKLRVTKAAMK